MSSRLSSISKELVQSQLNLGPQSVMEAPLEKRSTGCLPQLDPQFDNSTPDVSLSISKDSVERLELLSLSSQDTHCLSVGTCIIKRGTVDSLERWSDADLSNSDSFREQFSFTLPGEVPVEPVGASACLNLKTASRLDDSTPNVISEESIERLKLEASVTKKGTEKRRKRRVIHSFFKNVRKAMKQPFRCQNVVEPFVPLPELDDPELSHVPESSDCVPTNESIRSRYIVKKIIGEGGYGKVYEGIRITDGKKVAIKRIQKTIRDQYLQTAGHPKPLITEVALMLMMRQGPISPHVIQLYEWFEHPQKITLIMEYPDPCESLLDFINNNPNMNETTARLIMCQAVQAVLHCIECGVFHNDIHPENILLRKHTLELKLIDFGCGHLLSSNGYDCRQYRGIRAYFPPELFTYGKFHAVSTNVWALGVLLYEMVNTCSPFRNITEIMQAKIRFENPDLSKECRDLIDQCLTRDPTERLTLEQILQHDWFKTVALK
ncbi:serine/threonine-protein kinase pim-2-like [Onychostoma macrolepis]|uniref:serine/threonine-protein kinase pim-2-like n=1 Tax=Onychostoma macrolepis TaxID=369639 RepID=UPI00272AF0FB|nr:serine/threonine-protein kinase pim-2-like [Onychostoma macrolepis]